MMRYRIDMTILAMFETIQDTGSRLSAGSTSVTDKDCSQHLDSHHSIYHTLLLRMEMDARQLL